MKHTKPRILILEESPAKAKEAAQALQQNSRKFGIAIVASHPEFMETLRSFQADAVISAYRLSGFDGLALKETLAYDESLPFIL
jgi:CheY-like chemotaxis protein